MDDEKEVRYRDLLDRLSTEKPGLARTLRAADRIRVERLGSYIDGARLRGLEQLYAYLERLAEAFAEAPRLRPFAFLIRRASRDFETALEATLSGYQGVAADAMRDVMEIEALLLDFGASEGHAEEWLKCDRRTRLRKYGPAKVRERLKDAGIPPFAHDDFEPVDYRAHSEALHVTPYVSPVGGRGIEPDSGALLADAGFIEMFTHADRFLRAAAFFRGMYTDTGPSELEVLGPLDAFHDARDRTAEMLVMIVAFIEAPQVLSRTLGRSPTRAEMLSYVADEIEAKSPRS